MPEPLGLVVKKGTKRFVLDGRPGPSSSIQSSRASPATDHQLLVWVDDEGPGIGSTANLFVPFFTTKPAGSGIGLALSRQIAEAHNGTITLENRVGAPGCRATLRLPRA